MSKIKMQTIKQLCPSCGKEHRFEIEGNNGLTVFTSCPNTGKHLTATAEIVAIKHSKLDRLANCKKFFFWVGIVGTGYCALVGCVDFVTGYWGWGIVMVLCTLLNFNTARMNADY